MRLLFGVFLIGSVLWGGYWFIGERSVENAVVAWLDQTDTSGISVSYDSVDTKGFPNRFDTTISAPSFYDAHSGMGWAGAFLQFFALSYKPNHVIVVFPPEHELDIRDVPFSAHANDLRASIIVEPSTDLAIDRMTLTGEAVHLSGADGDLLTIDSVLVASRQAIAQTNAHDIAIELRNIALSDSARSELGFDGALPKVIDGLNVGTTLHFTDSVSIRGTTPVLEKLSIQKAQITWGNMALSLEGDITANTAGFADGTLTLKARDWRKVFAILERAGIVDPIWEGAIAPMAEADGNADDLVAPITMSNGLIYFGPLPIGPAPRLN